MSEPLSRRVRRVWLELATALRLKKNGIFIPYRHAGSVQPIEYPAFETMLRRLDSQFIDVLKCLETYSAAFGEFGGEAPNPRFEQDWFPRLDLAVAYTFVSHHRPKKIVEIGSGHSTRVMARAILDGSLETELICIDPAPRASIQTLPLRHMPALFSSKSIEETGGLGDGDFLFIDSSHVAMPGSDVDMLFNQILPLVGPGCIVHIHDIFLPWAYPEDWQWRAYNEQLLLASLLQSDAYEVLFASQYVARQSYLFDHAPTLEKKPLIQGAFETSFWIRKMATAIG